MKNKFALLGFSLLFALMISIWPGSRVNEVSAEPSDCVPGPHHGNIGSQTWCEVDNPHLVDAGVTVSFGNTLTIEPGVVVKFDPGASLQVVGGLVADGTANKGDQILFTSNLDTPIAGSWPGIYANSGSTMQISYFELAYAGQAGSDYGSLAIRTSSATVSHGRIHDGLNTGVFLDGFGITPQLNDMEIDHYTGVGILQNKISMNPSYQDIRLHDNATNGLVIVGALTNRDITLDGSPAALNGAPIYIHPGFTVGSSTTMTITPGTQLEMIEGISVAGGATLVAEGTEASPIIFTTYADPPQPGSWQGILANAASTLKLSYCELAYAGQAGSWALQIDTSNARVNQCRIHDSLWGILIKAATPFPLWNTVLTDNSGPALDVESGGHLQAIHTTLARNQVGLYVPSGSATLINTIVANNMIGVQQASTGSITLNNTLFESNTDPIVGTVTDINHIDGMAAFGADGYHLSRTSDAIDAGIDAGVNVDIDGETRPVGSPDLGADEYTGQRSIFIPMIRR